MHDALGRNSSTAQAMEVAAGTHERERPSDQRDNRLRKVHLECTAEFGTAEARHSGEGTSAAGRPCAKKTSTNFGGGAHRPIALDILYISLHEQPYRRAPQWHKQKRSSGCAATLPPESVGCARRSAKRLIAVDRLKLEVLDRTDGRTPVGDGRCAEPIERAEELVAHRLRKHRANRLHDIRKSREPSNGA